MSRLYTQHYRPSLDPSRAPSVYKKFTVAMVMGSLTALGMGIACYAAGVRVNTTKSIPVGFYLTSASAIEKGAYVMLCPPPGGVFDDAKQRQYIAGGLCPGGYGYMMKRVLAAKSDVIQVSDDGVRVNGELLPLSTPLKADKAGRPLPHYRTSGYALGSSELLLMSDVSTTSFDGRYFGPVNLAQIKSVIVPLLVW